MVVIPPLSVVVPLPPIVPPIQLRSPLTVKLPAPVKVGGSLLMVKAFTVTSAVSTGLPLRTTSSLAAGTPMGFQLLPSNQSFAENPPTHVFVVACAAVAIVAPNASVRTEIIRARVERDIG